MNFIKISIGIFLALAASRFMPHPPNFTSLIAFSFYIPLIFGIKFLPILLLSFVITDFFIGYHAIIRACDSEKSSDRKALLGCNPASVMGDKERGGLS